MHVTLLALGSYRGFGVRAAPDGGDSRSTVNIQGICWDLGEACVHAPRYQGKILTKCNSMSVRGPTQLAKRSCGGGETSQGESGAQSLS